MRAATRRRFLLRLPLMAGSLVAAVLFWFVVNVRDMDEVGFMVPLVYEGIPERYLIDGSPLEAVYVRLSGTRQALGALVPQQLRVRAELPSARSGSNVVRLAPGMVELPPGVAVVEINPAAVNLRLIARPREGKGAGG